MTTRPTGPLARSVGAINAVLLAIGGAVLIALMLITVAHVTLRFAGRAVSLDTSGWTDHLAGAVLVIGPVELTGYLGATAVALALGYAQERKSHVAVDIITRRFPRRVNRWIDRVRYLAKLALTGLLAWQLVKVGRGVGASGELSETLKMRYDPFVFILAGGFMVLALTVLSDLVNTFIPAGRKGTA